MPKVYSELNSRKFFEKVGKTKISCHRQLKIGKTKKTEIIKNNK